MSDLVTVKVVENEPTGVRVKILETGQIGFIRRQELSWDRRVDVDPPRPEIGDPLEARVIGQEARFVRLSLRVGDPWEIERAAERFRVGQPVLGHVIQLNQYGAFVQLAPGVHALARPQTIPIPPGQSLQVVLAVGDKVQAVIMAVDESRREIEISLVERLRQQSLLTDEERRLLQLQLFHDALSAEQAAPLPVGQQSGAPSEVPLSPVRRRYPSLAKLERVLIVEDNEVDRIELHRRIEEAFNVRVTCAKSGPEALAKAREGIAYELILVDVNLPARSALEIMGPLKAAQPGTAIVFMSHDPAADDRLPGNLPFVLKDHDFVSVVQCIERMTRADGQLSDEIGEDTPARSGKFIEDLGMKAFAQRSLEDTLPGILQRLRLQTQASQVIVFEVDSDEKKVSVLAADPVLDDYAHDYLLDGLYYSPIQNVVEDEEPYREINTLVRKRHPRFKRLYEVLPFRSCVGLPLAIPDMETRHALFLFNEDRLKFELEDLDNARVAARFLQVALERAAFFGFMQLYEERYSRGVLMGSLMHELAIKLTTLGSLVDTLPVTLTEAGGAIQPARRAERLQEAQDIATELSENKQELQDLADAYLKLAKKKWEAVDVNAVVDKVKLQMNKLAEETEVTMHTEPGDLPAARAISSRLEQVLLNVVLNAIQQIGRQREAMAKLPRKQGDLVLLQKGQVIIQTQRVEADSGCSIRILVIDSGPGVRYPDKERIFRREATTREQGHGWGLFISRNLIELMHGRLQLVDSVRFMGSAFSIELPAFS